MNANFFKTNWFALAMGGLLLFAFARKYPQFNPFHAPLPGKTGKITEESSRKTGAALLGMVTDDTRTLKSADAALPNAAETEAFLKRFANVAVSERKKFGIPASVILAAAYANTKGGAKAACKDANNYFALFCNDDWEGEKTEIGGKCYRQYASAWESFRDFSIYLSGQEWFGGLKKSAGKDWHKWVEKLDAEMVAEAKVMKKVIEEFELNELD